MYDLRDPNYVPPHLRPPEGDGAPYQPAARDTLAESVPIRPAPERTGKRGPNERYHFSRLEVGHWFNIPPTAGHSRIDTVRSMCSNKGKKLGRKFKCKLTEDGTIRVWREA